MSSSCRLMSVSINSPVTPCTHSILEDYFITLPDGSKLGNAEGTDISDNESLTSINGTYYTNNTTYALKEFHGSALPKVYGSFTGTVSYKSLTFSALFTYSLGGQPMMGYTVR